LRDAFVLDCRRERSTMGLIVIGRGVGMVAGREEIAEALGTSIT